MSDEADRALAWETLRTHQDEAASEASLQALDRIFDRIDEARDDGLTEGEGEVMDHLTAAVGSWASLPREHPNELPDFVEAIHRCQALLAVRVARRHHPRGWPVK